MITEYPTDSIGNLHSVKVSNVIALSAFA